MAWFRAETVAGLHLRAQRAVPTRLVLRGRIVTMDSADTVIPDGLLAIETNRIVHLCPATQALPAPFAGIQPIATNGTIYPGLFELHNHPSYNAIPLWPVPTRFDNRAEWRRDANYIRRVSTPATLLTHDPVSDNAKSVIRFVECRALLGGVTTTQGLSLTLHTPAQTIRAYRGLVRNLELPDDPSWPASVDRINDFTSANEATDVYGPLRNNPAKPFLMHLSEGTNQAARDVFNYLQRPDGSWLFGKNFVGIHGTALDPAQIQAMRNAGGLVWSPLSNFLLYGATTNIIGIKEAGVPFALGSDWAPSGTKNLLGELKIAQAVSRQLGTPFSDLDLVRAVTTVPAGIVGWTSLGSLEPGKLADLLIIDGVTGDPYTALISATEHDIVAVLIDGRPRVGRTTILDPQTTGVEAVRVANQDLVLDLTVSPTHPLANTSLTDATRTLSDALAHLPNLAAHFAQQHALAADTPRLSVHLEMDETFAQQLALGTIPIGPGDVDPMTLDPITAVDDTTFVPRLKANPNLPSWLTAGW